MFTLAFNSNCIRIQFESSTLIAFTRNFFFFLLHIKFESDNSHYPIRFRNTFSLIHIRCTLNCRVDTCYCKSELSEQVLGWNFVGIKKKKINIIMCKLSLGCSFLLLLINELRIITSCGWWCHIWIDRQVRHVHGVNILLNRLLSERLDNPLDQ